MEVTYKWELGEVHAKPTFTDKHGNVRNNVIKKIELIFTGIKGNQEEKLSTYVDFKLIDLSEFVDATLLTKEQVLEWGLSEIDPKEKAHIEKQVKIILGEEENGFVTLEIS